MSEKRKVLVSPTYGAGWSSWNSPAQKFAEYQPIIDFIEAGGNPRDLSSSNHPLILQLKEDLGMTPDGYVCTLGCDSLVVREVSPPYKIVEYDGSEYIIDMNNLWT